MADAEMNRIWAAETWKRMEEKLHRSLLKNGDKILYTIDKNGDGEDCYTERPSCWINGFWPGILWQLYQGTGDGGRKALYAEHAKRINKMIIREASLESKKSTPINLMWLKRR